VSHDPLASKASRSFDEIVPPPRAAGNLKKQCIACSQRFDSRTYASGRANGHGRHCTHVGTYVRKINKNRLKITNVKNATLATGYALCDARIMNYVDRGGLIAGEHIFGVLGQTRASERSGDSLVRLRSASKRYKPSCQLATTGARKHYLHAGVSQTSRRGIGSLVRGELTRPWTVASLEIANSAGDVMIRPREQSSSLIRR
jgi:hypothetical protein